MLDENYPVQATVGERPIFWNPPPLFFLPMLEEHSFNKQNAAITH
jgi:hypothetical protein